MTGTNLFCEKCSLQFDKKIVYDIHLSFVHNVKENKDEKLTENNEKDRGLGLSSKSEKPSETFISHCYFIRLNPRKKGTFKFCFLALLGIHRNSKQKEFFRSSKGFLR